MSLRCKAGHHISEPGERTMTPAHPYLPTLRTALATTALLALGAGAARAHGGGGGVETAVEGMAGFSLSPVYHILVVHFPIALWLTAALFVFFRVFSDSVLAVRLEKSVWPLILLGSLAGFVAYGLGLSIYPWSAITQSPLGRNHIMLATWTLSYWTVLGVLGYRFRRFLFDGVQKWVTFVLTLIGAAVGGAAGGGYGYYVDKQEQRLRQELTGTGVQVIRNGDTLQLVMPGNITFASGSSDIASSFYPTLNSLVKVFKEFDQNGINIVGHTDSTGSQELNIRLSRERATSVASYLSGQGVSSARISSAGVGPSQPIASNDTAQGKAENRRVSVNILVSKGLDGM